MKISKLRVLVVEDNPTARRLMATILKDIGVAQVFSATDGREAQEFLDSAIELVDIIICDWQMPRMTGLELLQQVRTAYVDMPFMMVTANRDIDSIKAARQFGVNAYIGKPYSPAEVLEKLSFLAAQI